MQRKERERSMEQKLASFDLKNDIHAYDGDIRSDSRSRTKKAIVRVSLSK